MSEIRPAATAVIVREADQGFEVLLMQRVSKKPGKQGLWVFPGGVLEDVDCVAGEDDEANARRAACRETQEESALIIDPADLAMISHWTTPDFEPRRWSTWFFLTDKYEGELQADGEEMAEGVWFTPAEAVERHKAGELVVLPPTIVTLTELERCKAISEVFAFYAARQIPWIAPRLAENKSDDDAVSMLYAGDAGYDTNDATVPGSRNRSILRKGIWEYQFTGQ